MPLFFALSGAVFALKPISNLDSFIKAKIKRLIFPYFIYAWFFMIPLKYLGNFYTKSSALLAMRGILLGIDSGHLWFLPTLFWCMLLFVLLQKIVSQKTKSLYLLLFLSGLIQITCSYLPFDCLFLKQGLGYLFWFTLGYVFEWERRNHSSWNLRTSLFAFLMVTIIEIGNHYYNILPSFYVILCGLFQTYLFADLCRRKFSKITETKSWKILIRNLFYIYLLHDPLEYLVLKFTMKYNLLTSAFGCYFYIFARTILIFILSAILGEWIHKMQQKFSQILKEESKQKERKEISF